MKRTGEGFIYVLLTVSVLAGCKENEVESITLATKGPTELYSVINQSAEVSFTTTASWKASCAASWIRFSPKSGEAGNNTITVSTTSTNRTKSARSTQLVIESEGQQSTAIIRQRGEYAFFEDDELNIPSEGGTIAPRFWMNVADQVQIWGTEGLDEWVDVAESSARTRADEDMYVMKTLQVQPNTSHEARDGALFLVIPDSKGNMLGLDTLFIYQAGADDGYVSTDYSADGRVKLLSQATEGRGIPIVLMGDGFVDREVADSTYDQVMGQTYENLFSEEPIKSLREYFNVYQVTAVSSSNRLEGIGTTALGTVPDHQSMGIDVNAGAVMKYVKKVEGIDSLHTLAVVVPNTTQNRGITYMFRSENTDVSYAIALCPIIDSLKSEMFRLVLTHEAVGHGLAKLADEYVRSTEGSATSEDIRQLKMLQQVYGWHLNVDSEQDPEKVIWSRFISDPDYASEHISTYEGGYTFYKGIYRSTEESMMRSEASPFNAPSRQIIYNQVMKLGLGVTPEYEEFKAFDLSHQPTVWHYLSRTRGKGGAALHWAKPRIIQMP